MQPRSGEVKKTVIAVLRDSDQSLRAKQIVELGSNRLGMPSSRNTVENCLSTGCRGQRLIFERVESDLFRLALMGVTDR